MKLRFEPTSEDQTQIKSPWRSPTDQGASLACGFLNACKPQQHKAAANDWNIPCLQSLGNVRWLLSLWSNHSINISCQKKMAKNGIRVRLNIVPWINYLLDQLSIFFGPSVPKYNRKSHLFSYIFLEMNRNKKNLVNAMIGSKTSNFVSSIVCSSITLKL